VSNPLPTIHARASQAVLEELTKLGQSIDGLLALLDWPSSSPPGPDARVLLDLHAALLHEGVVLTGDPGFVLRSAVRASPSRYGVLGFVCMTQPDLRAALQALCRYLALWVEGLHFSLSDDPGGLWLSLEDQETLASVELSTRRLVRESVLAAVAHTARQLTVEAWRPLRLELRHASKSGAAWRELIGVGPEVGPEARFLIPAEVLGFELRYAQHAMARFFEAHAAELLQRQTQGHSVTEAVRSALLVRFQRGDFTLEEIARSQAMSARTLQRRLEEEGRGFVELVEETRRALALRTLEDPRVATTSVCFLLGYSDDRGFRRAFERWTGLSPAAWRARMSPDAD
jgi:AraC-like DNA-binding protein